MKYLLDTSALLAHFIGEPGGEQVAGLLGLGPAEVAIAAPSLVELASRLADLVSDPVEEATILNLYTRELCAVLPVDSDAAREAVALRQACPQRLPLIDSLIAGCARSRGLELVHRDHHLAAIPKKELKGLLLPEKT